MKTQIIFELTKEEKEQIKEASKNLTLGYSTFCRMVVLREARIILRKQKGDQKDI
ncbi:hypothetical protein LCGC14_2657550 [marine sediment metagenome]|uniref:Uncharacterized protein n=1 Tax=marine sediment metagenome TaxID=412755 RepID=A0A0F8ZT32_9ZZZZ